MANNNIPIYMLNRDGESMQTSGAISISINAQNLQFFNLNLQVKGGNSESEISRPLITNATTQSSNSTARTRPIPMGEGLPTASVAITTPGNNLVSPPPPNVTSGSGRTEATPDRAPALAQSNGDRRLVRIANPSTSSSCSNKSLSSRPRFKNP